MSHAQVDGIRDLRLTLAIRLERLAMAGRYIAVGLVCVIHFAGPFTVTNKELAAVLIVIGLHHAFLHGVFWTRRFNLLESPINLGIYLVEATVVATFTGGAESEFCVLYYFLLIGYTVYSREFREIFVVSLIVAACYAGVVAVDWFYGMLVLPRGLLCVKLLTFPICGGLVGTLSELLRKAERVSQDKTQALASSQSMLRMILDSTADPILVYNDAETIVDANEHACRFLGEPRQEIVGRKFGDFLFDDGTLSDKLAEIRAWEEYHAEQIFAGEGDDERTVEIHVRSFHREGQRYFVVVAHDITDRKALQEASNLANLRLGRLNRDLQQINEMKTGLIESVSRRIRSPLTALLGYLDLLLNEELGPMAEEQRKAMQSCRRGAQRIMQVINETPALPQGDADRAEDTAATRR